MRFPCFAISDSVLHLSDQIRALVREIDPAMTQTFSSSDDGTITIASAQFVSANYGSSTFLIGDTVLREMIEMQVPEFPISQERRQVASICLAPIWISCVGFPQPAVVAMSNQVSLLGGVFTRGFNDNVTLMISETNASPKVFDARRNRIPIVTHEWLDRCTETNSRADLSGFVLPPFRGLVFSSSDLSPEDHRKCKRRVLEGGGKWSDAFDSNVTMLVADCLSQTKKIELALSLSVPIVRKSFVSDPSKLDVINWWCLSDRKSLLFDGMCFSVHRRCRDIDTLQAAVAAHSGSIGRAPTHAIVPHGSTCPLENVTVVTPYWFWACIESRSLIPVEQSIMFSPLPYPGPIPELAGKVFYVGSVTADVRRLVGDMIRFAGGTVVYRATDTVSYAIGSDNNNKVLVKLSMELNIPIVRPTFVIDIVRTGGLPDFKKYGLDGVVKNKMLRKLCDIITSTNVSKQEEIAVAVERGDLETFTQEYTSTQNEVALEVKYESQTTIQETTLSVDPLFDVVGK